jgi:pyrimidine operon attenuation protein/uracil phosphoribosyltransferase
MGAKSIVLNQAQIIQKTERIAFEIIENTFEEPKIYIGGIAGNGFVFAERLVAQLKANSAQEIILFKIEVNKENPLQEAISFSIERDNLHKASVIVVDDVINSGRTLIYAVRELLGINLTALKVATLVNRTHRRFPIRADFVGLHISTTLQDNILVEFGAEEIAYLA